MIETGADSLADCPVQSLVEHREDFGVVLSGRPQGDTDLLRRVPGSVGEARSARSSASCHPAARATAPRRLLDRSEPGRRRAKPAVAGRHDHRAQFRRPARPICPDELRDAALDIAPAILRPGHAAKAAIDNKRQPSLTPGDVSGELVRFTRIQSSARFSDSGIQGSERFSAAWVGS